MTVLRHSSFASTGPTHHGQHFEALVLSKDDKGVHVDYGGKFDARIRMSSRKYAANLLLSLAVYPQGDHLCFGWFTDVFSHTQVGGGGGDPAPGWIDPL
jgi:ribosomal protein S1